MLRINEDGIIGAGPFADTASCALFGFYNANAVKGCVNRVIGNPNCVKWALIDTFFAANTVDFVNESQWPLFLLLEHDAHAQVIENCIVGADWRASSTIDAQIGVNIVLTLPAPMNSIGGTAFYAGGAAGAILYNDVSHA